MKKIILTLIFFTLLHSLSFSYMSNKKEKDDDELTFAEENGLGAFVGTKIYGMDNYYPVDRVYNAPGWQYNTSPKEGNYVSTWTNPSWGLSSYYRDDEGNYFFWDPVRRNWARTR